MAARSKPDLEQEVVKGQQQTIEMLRQEIQTLISARDSQKQETDRWYHEARGASTEITRLFEKIDRLERNAVDAAGRIGELTAEVRVLRQVLEKAGLIGSEPDSPSTLESDIFNRMNRT